MGGEAAMTQMHFFGLHPFSLHYKAKRHFKSDRSQQGREEDRADGAAAADAERVV